MADLRYHPWKWAWHGVSLAYCTDATGRYWSIVWQCWALRLEYMMNPSHTPLPRWELRITWRRVKPLIKKATTGETP
jgi:hypothetical protein